MNNNQAMTKEQVLALTAAMVSTAHVDGVRPEELALIQRFYDESGAAGLPPFDQASHVPDEGKSFIRAAASDAEFAEQLVLMCLMTGYADGHLSDRERAHVAAIAEQAGVGAERVDALLRQVKDALIGSIAHLPDSESVAAIAKNL